MENKAQALTEETEMEFHDILTQLVRHCFRDLGRMVDVFAGVY